MKAMKLALKMCALPVLLTAKSVEVCVKATAAAVRPAKEKVKKGGNKR